ncbi:MAG: tryptophan synthase subunit alpha [Candidatus Omnitrophota bacterium]
MNRINEKFKELKSKNKKAFIAFITCGDPSLSKTMKIAQALDRAGVDILELGVPFSDPLADGPTIQKASQRALEHDTNLKNIFSFVNDFRKKSSLPVALMTYYNPVLYYGIEKFCRDCRENGVDGVIVPDLPVEEDARLNQQLKKEGVASVLFIAPTSTAERKSKAVDATTGFIYYVSLTGVTGVRRNLDASLIEDLKETKKIAKDKPVCVGFGISTTEQIKQLKPYCDGLIVGSAIIKIIEEDPKDKNIVPKIEAFAKKLAKAVHE